MNYSQADIIADNIQSVGMEYETLGIDGSLFIRAFIYLVDSKKNKLFPFNKAQYMEVFPAYARERAEQEYKLHFPREKTKKGELPF